MTDINVVVAIVWTLLQPHMPIIATSKAQEFGKKVPEAAGKVWASLKKKFDTKEAARKALEDLIKKPDSEAFQTVFKVQLEKMLTNDSKFAEELSKLLPSAAGEVYNAHLDGDGAIAQGAGAKAVGAGGIMIGGNVSGNLVTGNSHRPPGDSSTDAPPPGPKKDK
ncbi:MAG: hypothetical protein RBS68_02270 [Anaerolineales bacterium]|jgi:hypothetical protein|nr:hypothetical protein [Anaerolineales bacterium]